MSAVRNVYALALSAHRARGFNVECFLQAAFIQADTADEAEGHYMPWLLNACPPSQGWAAHQIKAQLIFDADFLREFPFAADLLVKSNPLAADEGGPQELIM
ncbi:MAG TPA: hypothetical protein VIP46_22105 [Pyrinomonadaceae bacterium]